MTSTEDYDSSAGERNRRGRSLETASIREDWLCRLRAPNHSPRPQAIRRERSQNLPAYDNASLPPLPQQGPAEVRELTSILKRPSNAQADAAPAAARGGGKGWLGSVQARFGVKHETYKPTFAEDKLPVGRKGVTFAGDQIREFWKDADGLESGRCCGRKHALRSWRRVLAGRGRVSFLSSHALRE